MRSLSITVKLTPRQAVAAMRALEVAGAEGVDGRAYRVRERVMFGLFDAGWKFDEDGTETWTHDGGAPIPDPVE